MSETTKIRSKCALMTNKWKNANLTLPNSLICSIKQSARISIIWGIQWLRCTRTVVIALHIALTTIRTLFLFSIHVYSPKKNFPTNTTVCAWWWLLGLSRALRFSLQLESKFLATKSIWPSGISTMWRSRTTALSWELTNKATRIGSKKSSTA